MADIFTKAQRIRCMSRIRSKGTSIELAFAKALRTKGIKYLRNVDSLKENPDFVIKGYKIAVFFRW